MRVLNLADEAEPSLGRPHKRASFNAPSIASVPLLAKNTRLNPDHSANFFASGP
jgi:hypothetical protein